MQGIDLQIFIPLILINKIESFRDSYSLTKVLVWKFGLISSASIINRLKELQFITSSGHGNETYKLTAKGLKYLDANLENGKELMLEEFISENIFINSIFSSQSL